MSAEAIARVRGFGQIDGPGARARRLGDALDELAADLLDRQQRGHALGEGDPLLPVVVLAAVEVQRDEALQPPAEIVR